MEGPRAAKLDEFPSLRALTDVVFRPGMPEQYPQLFNAENRENLRVCVDAGRCVSHVGMTERGASLLGCTIQVCCIGAVSTHPDYRGQGLASACFDDAVDKAYRDGVDLMLISGDRSLYRRRGCMRVGGDSAFTVTDAQIATIDAAGLPAVTGEPITNAELPQVAACYQQEAVRFLRPLEDWQRAMDCGWVMNRRSDFLLTCEGGAVRGYVILQQPGEDGIARISEFGGDRRALLAALPEIFRRYNLREARFQVLRHDTLLRSLCAAAGFSGTPVPTAGTVKIINFPQWMERMRPRWEELLGTGEAAKLSFQQYSDQYGFRFADEEWTTDRDTATRLLLGTPEGEEGADAPQKGPLADALRTILPLPTLWYGLNYV